MFTFMSRGVIKNFFQRFSRFRVLHSLKSVPVTAGKKISELTEEQTLNADDMLVVATAKGTNRKATTRSLFRAMHRSKTVAAAKNDSYEHGEIITIVDYSNPKGLAQGQFMCFRYIKKPDWFTGDVPNALYEVAQSEGTAILINIALCELTNLILSINQAKQLTHLLNNTGKWFFEPYKKVVCVMIDNVIKTISLKSLQQELDT